MGTNEAQERTSRVGMGAHFCHQGNNTWQRKLPRHSWPPLNVSHYLIVAYGNCDTGLSSNKIILNLLYLKNILAEGKSLIKQKAT